ncbi:MAG: GTP-binding protein [Candidatus Heimdallarchaeota archaeon]
MARVPLYKVTLLGDGAVGKTALRDRFMGKAFTADYMMTIGADFATKVVDLPNAQLKFQLWDLAGQPRFEAVRELYYRGSLGGMLIFDVTRPPSFENTPSWVKELWKNNGKGKIPIVILGNKIDLRGAYPENLGSGHGMALAKNLSDIAGFHIPYLETSAKTGENVNEAFALLGQTILQYIKARMASKK